MDVPELRFNVDRTRAEQLGLTQQDVANSLLISLSSSTQIAPNYWINPHNSVDYPISVQTPQYRVDSTSELLRTPIHARRPDRRRSCSPTWARSSATPPPSVVNHYNVQPLYDVYANVQDRDLGAVAGDVDRVLAEFHAPACPRAASSKPAARWPPCAARSSGWASG